MASSTAKNLRRITESVEQHDSSCEAKAKAVLLCPYEFDRLGFDHITTKSGRRVPISSDDSLGTGRLRVVCDGYHGPKKDEKQEYEEPVVRTVEERELVPAGAPAMPWSEPSSDPETDLLEFARRAFEEVGTQKNHWPFPTIIPPNND